MEKTKKDFLTELAAVGAVLYFFTSYWHSNLEHTGDPIAVFANKVGFWFGHSIRIAIIAGVVLLVKRLISKSLSYRFILNTFWIVAAINIIVGFFVY